MCSEASFKTPWASGVFDKCDYYALTAPIDEWSVAPPLHCISEPGGEITDDDWGIVTWHMVVYIYSSLGRAQERARKLGGNVKPLRLKCLACFARAFSTHYSYVDMVLDESWRIETYTCRELEVPDGCGVSHVRLAAADGTFQLSGCAATNSLQWDHYRDYGDPQHPAEWCRPVAFPFEVVFHDHTPHGGPLDCECLAPPDSLEYLLVDDHLIARDSAEHRCRESLFARPLGDLAFASIQDEKVRATRGEGVWVPIARCDGRNWQIMPWAQQLRTIVQEYADDPARYRPLTLSRDSHWFTNEAMWVLEAAFLSDDEESEDSRRKAIEKAKALLAQGVKGTPWDWYARCLHRDLSRFSLEEVPAILHADRMAWASGFHLRGLAEEEFRLSQECKPNYDLAVYMYSVALRHVGLEQEGVRALRQVLKLNPRHPQALYELALVAMKAGDEEEELRLYRLAVQSDPSYAPAHYNIGKTLEDRGDLKGAEKSYLCALEHMPHFVEALNQMASVAYRRGDYAEAGAYLRRLLVADPRRKETYGQIVGFVKETQDFDLWRMAMAAMESEMPREFLRLQEDAGGDDE